MNIEHVAVWVEDLEKTKSFYCKYFKGSAGEKYVNADKGFSSYFISFSSGARLELMHRHDIIRSEQSTDIFGYHHFAIAVGSLEQVDSLTALLRSEGVTIAGAPRWTGDGYYESVVLDPEGNTIEITI